MSNTKKPAAKNTEDLQTVLQNLIAQGKKDGVIRASCLFDSDRNKIVAYYVGEPDKKEIIDQLKTRLPKYMIPNIFIKEEALPLNKNGKIDRQQLRKMYQAMQEAARGAN